MPQSNPCCVVCEQALDRARALLGYPVCIRGNCEATLRQHLASRQRCCSNCGRLLQGSTGRSPDFAHCQLHDCQTTTSLFRGSGYVPCLVCGVVLRGANADWKQQLCGSPCCQQWMATSERAQQIAMKVAEREVRRTALANLAAQLASAQDPEVQHRALREVVVLPHMPDNLQVPSTARLERTEQLLLQLADEAERMNASAEPPLSCTPEIVEAPTPPEADSASQPDQVLAQNACALCGGWCCRIGGDSGLLSVSQFRVRLQKHPNLSPRDLVAEYLRQIPDKTQVDSCIFHGRDGCGLTTEMRSVTCNTYMCNSLQQLQAALQQNKTHFLMASTNLREAGPLQVYQIEHCPR